MDLMEVVKDMVNSQIQNYSISKDRGIFIDESRALLDYLAIEKNLLLYNTEINNSLVEELNECIQYVIDAIDKLINT